MTRAPRRRKRSVLIRLLVAVWTGCWLTFDHVLRLVAAPARWAKRALSGGPAWEPFAEDDAHVLWRVVEERRRNGEPRHHLWETIEERRAQDAQQRAFDAPEAARRVRPQRAPRRLVPARLADARGRVLVSLALAIGVLVAAAGASGYFTGTGTGTASAVVGNFSYPVTHFVVSAPSGTTAGSPFSVTVTAKDRFGNTVTGYTGTVHFTSTDTGAATVLPADYTFTTGSGADDGTHTFTDGMTLVTAGAQTVTAKDTSDGSITGTANITVAAAPATHFSVSAPLTATAGGAFSLTVTALDQFGNTATGYVGTVDFTKSDSAAGSAVPADYTFVAGDDGAHTFTNAAALVTAGAQTVTATDTVTSSITGTANITVVAGTATHFSVSAPLTATAGSAFSVTVTALDQFGNTATGYTGTAHFTTSDSGTGVTLPPDYTFVAGDDGAHTFTGGVTMVTAGAQTVAAKDTNNGSITGTSGPITVAAGSATHYSVSAMSPQTAGVAFSVTVTAKDQFGNTTTGYTGTAHFTTSDSGTGVALPADYTFVAGDDGTHTFTGGVTMVTAGAQTVTAKDTNNGSITGTSGPIMVSAGAATQIVLTGSTSSLASGSPRTFTAQIEDAAGNPVTSGADSTDAISFSQTSSSPGSVSFATSSATSAGQATDVVTGALAGSVTIEATATVNSVVTNSNTKTFTVTFGTATQVVLTGSTSSLLSGSPRTFTAQIEDAAGNPVTSGADSTDGISFSQTSSPPGSVSFATPSTTSAGQATDVVTGALAGSVTIEASGTVNGAPANSNPLTFTVNAATQSWSLDSPAASPSGRYLGGMVYDGSSDATGGDIVLFGGGDGPSGVGDTSWLNDTWAWNGTTWTQQDDSSGSDSGCTYTCTNNDGSAVPDARDWPSMAYDPESGTTVLFGGYDNGTVLNDTWVWTGSSWAQVADSSDPACTTLCASSPEARYGATMAYDPHANSGNGAIVLFGGITSPSGGVLDDTWILTESGGSYSWTQVADSGIYAGCTNTCYGSGSLPLLAPGSRYGAAMAYDASPTSGTWEEMVLFGGNYTGTDSGDLDDTYALSYAGGTYSWTQVDYGGDQGCYYTCGLYATAPAMRDVAGMVYDPNVNLGDGGIVLFGGNDGGTDINDTWVWNGSDWTQVDDDPAGCTTTCTNSPSGSSSPSPRYGAGIAYDPFAGIILFSGGAGSPTGGAFLPVDNATWTYG